MVSLKVCLAFRPCRKKKSERNLKIISNQFPSVAYSVECLRNTRLATCELTFSDHSLFRNFQRYCIHYRGRLVLKTLMSKWRIKTFTESIDSSIHPSKVCPMQHSALLLLGICEVLIRTAMLKYTTWPVSLKFESNRDDSKSCNICSNSTFGRFRVRVIHEMWCRVVQMLQQIIVKFACGY
jgi:hypothetical protein